MGFRYTYDVEKAVREINAAAFDACNPSNDGFTAWGAKQDLYRIKWIVETALKKCPTFSIEDDWLKEQEKVQMLKILSSEINDDINSR